MIDIQSMTTTDLARFVEEHDPLLIEVLGAPGEPCREIEDLRTAVALARITLRRRRIAELTARAVAA